MNDDPDARVGAPRVREESAGVQAEHALGLQMLRATFGLTQTELAGALGVSRANVAQTEQRGDMLVSTLRRYAETITGGELRLLVTVPGRAPLEFNLIEVEGAERAADRPRPPDGQALVRCPRRRWWKGRKDSQAVSQSDGRSPRLLHRRDLDLLPGGLHWGRPAR